MDTQRTREIGVRMALGARATDIYRLVLGHAGFLVAAGLGAGIVLAIAATRFLAALLLDVSPTDPVTFGLVVLILACVALLAGFAPARRATRVDPIITLKAE